MHSEPLLQWKNSGRLCDQVYYDPCPWYTQMGEFRVLSDWQAGRFAALTSTQCVRYPMLILGDPSRIKKAGSPGLRILSIAFQYWVGGRIRIHIVEILNFGCTKILRLALRVLASLSWLRVVTTSGSCKLLTLVRTREARTWTTPPPFLTQNTKFLLHSRIISIFGWWSTR